MIRNQKNEEYFATKDRPTRMVVVLTGGSLIVDKRDEKFEDWSENMIKYDDGKPDDPAIQQHALEHAMNDNRPPFLRRRDEIDTKWLIYSKVASLLFL